VGSGVASSVRPRRYYKIPKETLESSLDDLENLINFFVIEGQRIVFAENIPVTGAVSTPQQTPIPPLTGRYRPFWLRSSPTTLSNFSHSGGWHFSAPASPFSVQRFDCSAHQQRFGIGQAIHRHIRCQGSRDGWKTEDSFPDHYQDSGQRSRLPFGTQDRPLYVVCYGA